eukprot:8759214-Pyramimonas_sp.AAC.1
MRQVRVAAVVPARTVWPGNPEDDTRLRQQAPAQCLRAEQPRQLHDEGALKSCQVRGAMEAHPGQVAEVRPEEPVGYVADRAALGVAKGLLQRAPLLPQLQCETRGRHGKHVLGHLLYGKFDVDIQGTACIGKTGCASLAAAAAQQGQVVRLRSRRLPPGHEAPHILCSFVRSLSGLGGMGVPNAIEDALEARRSDNRALALGKAIFQAGGARENVADDTPPKNRLFYANCP